MSFLSQTFGVEIECYLPVGRTMQEAANHVSARGVACQPERYGHSAPLQWKVVPDGSLRDYARGAEFVSPILSGADGLAQVETVCRALEDFGCTVNRDCGLHIHVGVANEDVGFFRRLVKLYSAYETVLDSVMPVSRRASNNTFCRSMTTVGVAILDAATSINGVIACIPNGRYVKLNLSAFLRHRTVEFRHHSGTVDATKVRNWAILCLKMVNRAKQDIAFLSGTQAPVNQARRGTKAHQIGEMMLRPHGVDALEVCRVMGWPSVSMPAQARACGLAYTTQRTGRVVRYFAVRPVATEAANLSIDGLADLIGLDATERQYFNQRAARFSGVTQRMAA